MNKIELVEELSEVSYKGESYQIRTPSNKELIDLRKMKDGLGEDEDSMEVMYGFLEKLGLPRTFSEKVTPKHLIQIMQGVSDTKN